MKSLTAVTEGLRNADAIVVGSGLYGLVVARELAEIGLRVVVLERRSHIGGNTFSEVDPESGIEIHKYGSHLFHTSNVRVWNWVNRFTDFTDYRHRVFSLHQGRIFEMPPTLREISYFYPGVVSASDAKRAIRADSELVADPEESFETKGISLVGEKMYRALIAGYTEKQWQVPPHQLPADYLTRLPFRTSHETGYFKDKYQGLPRFGYGEFIKRIAEHPNVTVFTESDYFDFQNQVASEVPVVYTGPLDKYFRYSAGHLRWRTLDFEFETLELSDFQSTAVMNYADIETPWTRIHEFRHLHPEREHHPEKTVIAREFSREAQLQDEPYYPVNSTQDREMLKTYRQMASAERKVYFGGRLASYLYLDMHMAIASALTDFEQRYSHFRRI